MSQTTNTLTPIGMAVAIAGKYMRHGDLVQSDSLAQIRSWVRPPMPLLLPTCAHSIRDFNQMHVRTLLFLLPVALCPCVPAYASLQSHVFECPRP